MSGILHLSFMLVIIRDEKRNENKDNLDVWPKKIKIIPVPESSTFFRKDGKRKNNIVIQKSGISCFNKCIAEQSIGKQISNIEIKREDEKEELYNEEKSISCYVGRGFDFGRTDRCVGCI